MAQQITGKIVQEYIERFPNTANTTLAKKIFNENKGVWGTWDEVRTLVRYYKGANGDKKRAFRGLEKPTTVAPTLPESYAEEIIPLKLRKQDNNILLLSDLHIPYHTVEAVNLAIETGVNEGCNTVVINGDLMDFHQMSKFEKDPRKRSVKQEFEATEQFLQYLRHKFPSARIVWMEGNHDARYPKWLMTHAQHFFDDEYYSLRERLNLRKYAVEFVNELTPVYAGKLPIVHGHHIVKGVFAPVNSGRGAFTRAIEPIIIGHTHKTSEHNETTFSGKLIVCYSTGCLCELRPTYNPQTSKNNHGFAIIKTQPNGDYRVFNKKIYKGEVY